MGTERELDLDVLDLLPDPILICTGGLVRWANNAAKLIVGEDLANIELLDLPAHDSAIALNCELFPLTIGSAKPLTFEARASVVRFESAPALLVTARPNAHRKALAQAQRALSRFIISATTLTHPSNERSHDIELELGRLIGDYADYFRINRVELLDSTGKLALSVEDGMVELDHDGSSLETATGEVNDDEDATGRGIWVKAASLGFQSSQRLLIGNRTGEMHLFQRAADHTVEPLDTHTLFAEVLLSALHNGREVGQLRFAAAHDSLTGLPNRVGFRAGLERHLGNSLSALLFIDLDGFKAINDELGHHVGDAVLAETARRLEQQLRPGDLAARLGGDEFAVAVGTSVAGHLEALAQRLATAIEQDMLIGPYEVKVGASVGHASLREHDTLDELMAAADKAMYEIKASRRTDSGR